ncbi:DUF2399 domain-containing protein [Synechococcus sp. BSF8S]|uniref:ATP-binding protein n=1 Tax=Synechococcales TaxID=1890424 RepID=UPI001628F356|nr:MULTISPECIES: ATP-binding protein [unclassified Synechococcus]MBC1260980.1 DUF2399 domain-containing protein [Synechococcus sp. BSF8S]MBC1263657.1 DUF2399 domain-containing protein [Synechococcus sp. BSA11S]
MTRTTFTVSRAAEFFSEKELEMQMGASRESWLPMLLKELIDNALDAAEGSGVALPEITITLEEDAFIVADNGPGIPPETVEKSLDYLSRTSSNNLYVSPTRGQLGNALKCLYAAGFVRHSCGDVTITAKGIQHHITIGFDQIRNEPTLDHDTTLGDTAVGTIVRIAWPGAASRLEDRTLTSAFWLAWRYGLCNPHVTITLVGTDQAKQWPASPGTDRDFNFRKWKPSAPPSASWFHPQQFQQLLCAFLATNPEMYARDFIQQFHGMSASYTQKAILDELGLQRTTIADAFTADGEVLTEGVERLHGAIVLWSTSIKAGRLGPIGKDLLPRLEMAGVRPDSFTYKKAIVEDDTRPFVVEAWFAGRDPAEGGRLLMVGLNHSPVLQCPSDLIWDAMQDNNADQLDPIMVVLHLSCPVFDYIDRGKSRIHFSAAQHEAIRIVLDSVLAKWKGIKARMHRDQQASRRELEKLTRHRGVTIKEAAWALMKDAYLKASGGGRLPANARQVMYAARGQIQEMTGKQLDDQYFTQTLLPDFQAENFQLTEGWDVVYDDRGNLIEPHTGRRIPIGTVKVRTYIQGWRDPVIGDVEATVPVRISTNGPRGRFHAALFIEKEGFTALFEAARTSELYDVAIFSTKGMSTTAARRLVDRLSAEGVTIYLLHDFDAAGMAIANTIQTDGRRYKFNTPPNVVDLGLRLKQAQEMGLESEEFRFPARQKKTDPRGNLRKCGATEDEIDFLVEEGDTITGGWKGLRVELNAMTAPQFIEFVHGQLDAHGVKKVVPDEATLAAAYQHVRRTDALKAAVEVLLEEQQADGDPALLTSPDQLGSKVLARITGTGLSWEDAIQELARDEDTA